MEAYVLGIGILGPGLPTWSEGAMILNGTAPYRDSKPFRLEPALLPPTERRRAGRTVQLAIQVAQEAMQDAPIPAESVTTVFGSSDGDLQTMHELCLALSQSGKVISPTRFHNSVHNAAAGYWSIATGARTPSTSISCYDSTFAASLVEALCQISSDVGAVLVVAYDYPAPEPLLSKRTVPAPFGVALLLSRSLSGSPRGHLRVTLQDKYPESELTNPHLESVRRQVPAARSLPLLASLARNETDVVYLDYLDTTSLKLEVRSCR